MIRRKKAVYCYIHHTWNGRSRLALLDMVFWPWIKKSFWEYLHL